MERLQRRNTRHAIRISASVAARRIQAGNGLAAPRLQRSEWRPASNQQKTSSSGPALRGGTATHELRGCHAAPGRAARRRPRAVKAVVYSGYGVTPALTQVPDPVCSNGGVVLKVGATGVCRSDWHAWKGHDQVALPHIPGHELAGVVAETGPRV